MAELVSKIRKSIRITTEEFDDQIKGYCDYVKQDLISHNMDARNWSTVDPIIYMCCELYCKYMFDYENKGEWYHKRYRAVRDNMVTMMRYINAE